MKLTPAIIRENRIELIRNIMTAHIRELNLRCYIRPAQNGFPEGYAKTFKIISVKKRIKRNTPILIINSQVNSSFKDFFIWLSQFCKEISDVHLSMQYTKIPSGLKDEMVCLCLNQFASSESQVDNNASGTKHDQAIYGRGNGKCSAAEKYYCNAHGQGSVLYAGLDRNGYSPFVDDLEKFCGIIPYNHGADIEDQCHDTCLLKKGDEICILLENNSDDNQSKHYHRGGADWS